MVCKDIRRKKCIYQGQGREVYLSGKKIGRKKRRKVKEELTNKLANLSITEALTGRTTDAYEHLISCFDTEIILSENVKEKGRLR